jgi:hypothetical protein
MSRPTLERLEDLAEIMVYARDTEVAKHARAVVDARAKLERALLDFEEATLHPPAESDVTFEGPPS